MDPTMEPAIGRVRFDVAKTAWLWTMIGTGAIGVLVATPATLLEAGCEMARRDDRTIAGQVIRRPA